MIAWRRIASWAAAGELAAVAELDRRRQAQVASGADPHLAEHVSDEVAMALTLTSWAAGTLVGRAAGLARLPRTMTALAAGEIDMPKALVILGELSGLGDVHAARVEAALIGRAPGWTTGELRRAARREVFAADPAAARRRKERAEQQARVERWAEDAGTAALAGRDLPPTGVLAADAHLTVWAKQLKAAGLTGNLDQLRAQVYLTLLNGQPPESLFPTDTHGRTNPTSTHRETDATSAHSKTDSTGTHEETDPTGTREETDPTGTHGDTDPTGTHSKTDSTGTHEETDPTSAREKGQAPDPVSGQRSGSPPGRAPDPPGPSVRGSVNLVLPLSTWLGWSASPGEVAGFGPLDAADSRALAAALARDPATKWCVTVTGPDGRAVAHGCAKAGPGPPTEPDRPGRDPGQPPPAAGDLGARPRQPPPARARPGGDPKRAPPAPSSLCAGPGPPPPPGVRAWLTGVALAWLETDECSHRRESPGYRPSRSLTHLIQARQVTCTAPGCRRPATSCDFEHTIPYHLGGRSCECNGGPCCRRHHRAKQTGGWRLSQPRPGSFVWTTPHGRSYRTEPEPYPT